MNINLVFLMVALLTFGIATTVYFGDCATRGLPMIMLMVGGLVVSVTVGFGVTGWAETCLAGSTGLAVLWLGHLLTEPIANAP